MNTINRFVTGFIVAASLLCVPEVRAQTAANRSTLYTQIDTLFPDVSVTQISPADVRLSLKNIAASSYNGLTDGTPTMVGLSLLTAANPSAVRFMRINADNSVSFLDAASFLAALGPITLDGTVRLTVLTNTATSYTILATDNIVTLNNAASVAVVLPPLAGITGKPLRIKNLGSGLVTITGNAAETIFTFSAVTSFSLQQGESVDLTATSAYWIAQ